MAEATIAELSQQYGEARAAAEEARVRAGGRLTHEVLLKDNVSLGLALELASRQTELDRGEIEMLRNAVQAGQDEIARLSADPENLRASRDMYRDKFMRASHAIDCANRVRDQYYRALVAATRDKGERPPPTPEEMAKTFGVADSRPPERFPRAGKPRIASPALVVKWASKF